MLTDGVTYAGNEATSALDQAVLRLMTPLARLCLAQGMRYDAVEELLKRAFMEAARDLHPDQPERGLVSRLAAATGLNRREVTRLTQASALPRPVKIPLASQIIARWATDPCYRDEQGAPRPLCRQGECPSFESLARSVTQDLHPRTVLDELLRLGLANHDEATDQVALLQADYVPGASNADLVTLLGDNVGDHLESAVANIVKDDIQHHDQAVFADELSEESVAALAPIILQHWQELRDELVPVLTRLIEADREHGRLQDRRVRVGLYSFAESALPPRALHHVEGGLDSSAISSTKETD